MRKALFASTLLMLVLCISSYAQDTLNYKGRHYQFLEGYADTAKINGNTYIIKYVVEPEMGDVMRSNGKLYVVIMVLATIFAGIFAYLLIISRKISKLEKEK
jgi:hypothetical protein